MDAETLTRSCSSLGGQRRALEALHDESVRGIMTAAGALSYGVAPLGEAGGRVIFASVPGGAAERALALEAALGRPVSLVAFDEAVVREAIYAQYLRPASREGLDLPTFDGPEFLRDPASAGALLSAKSGARPEAEIRPGRGFVALVDLRLHSVRRPLDARTPAEFAGTESALGFRLAGDRAVLFRDRMPEKDTRAIIQQALFYDGDEHLHTVSWKDLTRLPHVVHPSEVQLAEIEGDEARFWVYDRVTTVKAGGSASWDRTYYFLLMGSRFERTLRLDVLAFALVKRSNLGLAGPGDALTPDDLARLFGLDFPRAATSAAGGAGT